MPPATVPCLASPPADRAAGHATTARRSAERWFASHELRTPLQAIRGGVELLLEERGPGLSALQVEAIGLIAGAAAALERCVAMLARLAALDDEAAPPIEPQPLGAWLATPATLRHLTPTPALATAAGLSVLLAPAMAARALACLGSLAATDEVTPPFVCDLLAVEPRTCTLTLAVGAPLSGDGAVAWQLATALLERAGVAPRQTGPQTTLLTLRRAL